MNRRQSSKGLMETYKRAIQGNKEPLDTADGASSSDSSPEKPDTYLNVESGDVPTDTATSGLVTGPDKFRLLGGLEPSPELIAISMVYFVQGILGLSRLGVSFMYKDEFHLEPASVAFLTSFAAFPWVVKPLYGFLSDTVPIFGYRRRSYLIICGLLGSASWAAMGTVVRSPAGALLATVVGSLGTACSDVVVDSIVVERSRNAPQSTAGSLQSLCWASAALGGVASAYFSGSLIETWGPRGVFLLTAAFPLVVSAAAVLINEQPMSSGGSRLKADKDTASMLLNRLQVQAVALWNAINQRSILLPAVFVFLWQATPTADTAMFYFQTNALGFTPEFLGRVRLAGSLASLAGVAVYNFSLKDVPLRKMFLYTSLLGAVLGMTQILLITGTSRALGLSNELFVLGDSVVLTVLGQVAFMPVLVLAAKLCPEGVEATLFATLMSILNGGSFAGSALGSGLTAAFGVTATNFTLLAPLIAVCTLSSLLPLPLLGMVPNTTGTEELQRKADEDAAGY
ncbi:g8825 [Coccomyxa viridis]|uniref:G8825 protein n=1 Tax=Coccomyxa viridis TaxID=1274662 RepID=A0ABP1G1G2_9CHLO